MLSLKKEMVSWFFRLSYVLVIHVPSIKNQSYTYKASGRIESFLPILYVKLGSIQAAVDQATKLLMASVRAFEEVAQRLVEAEGSSTAKNSPELLAFIDGCRFCCTGNLSWR